MAKSKKGPAGGRTFKVAPLDSAALAHGDLYLSEWMQRMGTKQIEIVREYGVNEGYLSAIKSGKHDANPTLDQLRVIARAVGIPVWALFMPPPEMGLQDHIIRFLAEIAKLPPPTERKKAKG